MFDELTIGVKEAVAVDPRVLTDEELIEGLAELHAREEQLAATKSAFALECDQRRVYATRRAKSCAAWMAWLLKIPPGEARQCLRLGRGLRDLELARAAWEAGEISRAQVRVLVGLRNDRSAEALERDEAMLVQQARELPFGAFQRAAQYWSNHADPDGTDQKAMDATKDDAFYFSQGFEGRWLGDLNLDPIGGTILHNEVTRLEERLFAQDWSEAKARLGREREVDDLRRSPAQRHAAALIEMAMRSAALPDGTRLPVPLFTVLMGDESLARTCELANGTVIAPGALVPWLGEFDLERIVFAGPSRVIDVGRRTRVFRGALRRAIEARDRTSASRVIGVRPATAAPPHRSLRRRRRDHPGERPANCQTNRDSWITVCLTVRRRGICRYRALDFGASRSL